jgi:ABC-type multidrug transport system ATPase subunit
VVIGGLATSTVLTLLVIPVGYVMLARIDRIFGRLGPWILMAWVAATASVIAPLVLTEQLVSLSWQIVTTALVAGALLWFALKVFRRTPKLEFDATVPAIEARYLSKTYGLPGPVKKAWRIGRDFAESGHRRTREQAGERALAFALLLGAGLYLAINLESGLWRLFFSFLSAGFAARVVIELLNALLPIGQSAPQHARDRRARINAFILGASPWLMIATLIVGYSIMPTLAGEAVRMPPAVYVVLAVGTLLVQLGRRSARLALTEGSDDIGRIRALFRKVCSLVFGFDLPKEEVEALATTSFSAKHGMIGILGPNGAGKSTLLRMLSGVLDPTGGSIHYSGRLKRNVGHYVSRWIGYLPQEFGLPDHLTALQYLQYFALLYQVGDRAERNRRVNDLLNDVGLSERRNDRIGGFSGGMRQRVAVARTLLREPPIIIVDEPTVGLDPRERIRFRNLLTQLSEGRVVLFSTHVVEDVAVSCRRVIVMTAGRISYDGKPAELARVAVGKTWEVRQVPGRPFDLPPDSKLVDEVPDAGGGMRLRILSETKPHEDATPVVPGIEDGYLQLMHLRGAE